jgi:predicted NUDIX family phosphoesterase
MSIFLSAAEAVLNDFGKPMYVKSIVQEALDKGILKSSGKTKINTMRARLAEDIRKHDEFSKFMRVGPNKFGLRKWAEKEYKSKPFVKDIRGEKVVCIPQNIIKDTGDFFGFKNNYKPYLEAIKNSNEFKVIERTTADLNNNLKQIVSYVVLRDKKKRILCYRRGIYSAIDDFLKGVLCIGFGGHVNDLDLFELFSSNDVGITNSAYREVSEELKNITIHNINFIGVINDNSTPLGLRHFAFVLEASLPKDFNVENHPREMSINQLQLLSENEIWKKYNELEFWSQLLCKHLFKKPKNFKPVVINTRRNLKSSPRALILVGEIGSGKSEIANYFKRYYKVPIISTRKCVGNLLGIEDFGEKSRVQFQNMALDFITSEEGPQKLAKEIFLVAKNIKESVFIIDGVRTIDTYKEIIKLLPKSHLIFIEVSKDRAYDLYWRRRGKKVPIEEFRIERNHNVENEIPLFKTYADVTIFNGGKLHDLYKELRYWWNDHVRV